MSDETPPVKERRAWRTWHLAVVAVVALLLGVGIGASGSSDSEDDEGRPVATSEPSNVSESPTTERETTTTVPESYVPAPGDFKLTVIETKKSCFGSAGCNVTYEVDLAYIGPRPLDSSDTWLVIYELVGAEDHKVGNIEVQGDRYSKDSDSVSTASQSARLTANPTAVRAA